MANSVDTSRPGTVRFATPMRYVTNPKGERVAISKVRRNCQFMARMSAKSVNVIRCLMVQRYKLNDGEQFKGRLNVGRQMGSTDTDYYF